MQEVSIIKRLTHCPCGHMGTLDPLASGVLPVGIGNATRLFDYFLSKRKTYIAQFTFGTETDTLDTTGNVLSCGGTIPTVQQIQAVLPTQIGEIEQLPPKYSAKNVDGKRGYELARAGVDFELAPKKVNVYSIELLSQKSESVFEFRIECGGGTYIRSIARDIAASVGTTAVMNSLIRTKSGIFTLEKSVKTESLNGQNIGDFIIPTQDVLPFDAIYPVGNEAKRLFNGLSVDTDKQDGLYKIYTPDGNFYGLAQVQQSKLKIRTKLC